MFKIVSKLIRTGLDRIRQIDGTTSFSSRSHPISSPVKHLESRSRSVVSCIKDVLVGSICFVLRSRRDSVAKSTGTPTCIPVQIHGLSIRSLIMVHLTAITLQVPCSHDDEVVLQ
ncbi:unnamed protein product [Cuscuta campestris]|uniref:Uncharacterized protein n=1 Tax=Cuscuta campestris TaxID=132261 RepID=A0A484KTN2_9ASTE|nr:unnamed protein product [Cuscuta campestris]